MDSEPPASRGKANGAGPQRPRAKLSRYQALATGLRQQLDIVETITSTAADGIFMADRNHRVMFANPAAERIFGFTSAELCGKNLHAMIHHSRPDGSAYPASECPVVANYAVGETMHDHRDVYFRKDGAPVHVSVSIAPLIRGGKTVAVVTIVRDITESESIPRELTRSNERLASALATAALGVWSVDFETGEVAWDDRVRSLLGVPSGEHIGVAEAGEFVHPADRLGVDEILNLPPEPDGDVQWEWRVIRRDGVTRWHQVRGRICRDSQGKALSAHGVSRDITDQKHAQEVQSRFEAIIESSDDSITSSTLDGVFLSWNRGAQAIFGYSPAEIIGRSAAALIPRERAAEMPLLLGRIARGENVERFETERVTKDGRLIRVSISMAPMRNESGQVVGVSAIARDITREKLLEEQLRQAEKMEAIGQLAGGIAHDFNNLLTVVNGYAGMALLSVTEGPLREQLLSIQAAGERATALTSQLLAFSRKQMLQPRVLDINSVVTAMHPLLRRVIREDIECVIALAPRLSCVKADRHQIEQVLLNLVVNAGDAQASGGWIAVETKDVVLDREYARSHPDVVMGPYVMLAVSDSGPGIEPGIRARIFEPFFTTKPVGKGTGLGLSMAYGIVRQSGGHITCYSEPGIGTTFRVYLPVSDEAGLAAHPVPDGPIPEDKAPESIRGTETILLVEDDPGLRTYAATVLKDLGYSVSLAADGAEALRIAEALRMGNENRNIDLLITDMVMPGIDGRELAARLTGPAAGMRVLFVSGYTENAIVRQGILEPGLAFLPKPYSPGQLAKKVRETLAGPQSVR